MARLPSLEPLLGLGLGLGARDLDQRRLRSSAARRAGLLPGRGRRHDALLLRRSAPALGRLHAGRLTLLLPALGRPRSAGRRAGTVSIVNASASHPGTSSHRSGVETRASGVGRAEYCDATVRSFAFWL